MSGPWGTALDLHGLPGSHNLVLGGAEQGGQDVTGTIAAHLPAPRLSVHAFGQTTAQSAARLPAPRLSLPVAVGTLAQLAARLPVPRLVAGGAALTLLVRGAAHLPAPRLRVVLENGVVVQLAARLPAPRLTCPALISANLLTGLTAATGATWQPGACRQATALSPQADVPACRGAARAPWSRAPAHTQSGPSAWQDAPRQTGQGTDAWRRARHLDTAPATAWHDVPRQTQAAHVTWADATGLAAAGRDGWIGLPLGTRGAAEIWRAATPAASSVRLRWSDGAPLRVGLIEHWRDAGLVYYVWCQWTYTPPPKPPKKPDPRLCLRFATAGGTALNLGTPSCPTHRIPTRPSYYMLHHFDAYRLDTGATVPLASVRISHDADAWGWSWSGTLAPSADALDSVEPATDGSPALLAVVLNDTTWHLYAEAWSVTEQFGSRQIQVSGRGLAAELADPFLLPASGSLQQDYSLQQALVDRLPLGTDWTLLWADDTPDWLLPAGAWSWTNVTPIQAIAAAVKEVGLILRPATASRELTVQPRYPVLPWLLDEATPDIIIPEAAIQGLQRATRAPTQGNVVYVQGGETGGILARVYRDGSAADRPVDMVQSDLITHLDGARLLGSRILAGQHEQPIVRSVTMPLGGDWPLLQVGELVQIGASVRGIIAATAIDASPNGELRRASQTITLGEDSGNRWAAWLKLQPGSPLRSGQVVVATDGQALVGLPGAGSVRVRYRGEAPSVGSRVWVQEGWVQGAAPDMEVLDVAV